MKFNKEKVVDFLKNHENQFTVHSPETFTETLGFDAAQIERIVYSCSRRGCFTSTEWTRHREVYFSTFLRWFAQGLGLVINGSTLEFESQISSHIETIIEKLNFMNTTK